jgi:hypothetical protein
LSTLRRQYFNLLTGGKRFGKRFAGVSQSERFSTPFSQAWQNGVEKRFHWLAVTMVAFRSTSDQVATEIWWSKVSEALY